ncbi:MAG: hypothetical protein RMY29_028755 [Nostoc sp. CreGUA01]|nr:hypothetical protein [Nostoc sp. CreGUA01]
MGGVRGWRTNIFPLSPHTPHTPHTPSSPSSPSSPVPNTHFNSYILHPEEWHQDNR